MVKVIGSVKCFYCGHVSGHISRDEASARQRFTPRPGFGGELPRAGQPLKCERCRGPVFLDESDRILSYEMPVAVPTLVKEERTERTPARPLRKSA
jgi:hypothetical protein